MRYKIVDQKENHLFEKKVFNSFQETYSFIDSLTFEEVENIGGLELFCIPTEDKGDAIA